MKGQQGQALVGVLVVMTVVFLLAGSVAVATSTLVSSEKRPDDAVVSDLRAQSAVAAAVAYVANGNDRCATTVPTPSSGSGPGSQAPTSVVSTSPVPPIQLPGPAPGSEGSKASVFCVRVTPAPTGLNPAKVRQQGQQNDTCFAASLSDAGSDDLWLIFNARWGSKSGSVFVAGEGQGCPQPKLTKCAVTVSTSPSPITQVAIPCGKASVTGITKPTLYVRGAQTLGQVFVGQVPQAQVGGAGAYLMAVGTGMQGQLFEEGVWVSAPNVQPQLRFEGALQ